MKKLLTGLAIALAVSVVSPVLAQADNAPAKSEKIEKQRGEKQGRKNRF